MNCKHINSLLSPYLDNELSARDHAQVQAHLATCPVCAADLHALQSAVAWLQADVDALNASTASMPDLYGAFQQRLITQPARASVLSRRGQPFAWTWMGTRIALPIACVLVVLGGFQLYAMREAAARREAIRATYKPQEELAEALRQPYQGAVHVVEVRHGRGPGYSGGVWTTEQWLYQGYRVQTVRSTGMVATRVNQSGQVTEASPTPFESVDYYTPAGVRLSWWRYPPPNAVAPKDISLFWEPQDPELHQDVRMQDIEPTFNSHLIVSSPAFGATLITLSKPGMTQNIHIDASVATERMGNFTCHKLTFTTGVQVPNTTPMLNKEFISMPSMVTVWLDENHRLRRCVQIFGRQDGTQWSDDAQITYDQATSPWEHAPSPPENKRVVQGHYSFSYDAYRHRLPDPPVKGRSPIWLLMTGEEKQEIKNVIAQFGEAWGAHDLKRLRGLVDTEHPLEITRPERRQGLTGEDVWQQAWVNRLAQEPQQQDFRILPDFAIQVNDPPLNAVPLDMSKIPNDVPFPSVSLTGLNVLAWVKAQQTNGTTNSFSAQLYLVKRPEGWKIFQFARGRYCASDILSQVDREAPTR